MMTQKERLRRLVCANPGLTATGYAKLIGHKSAWRAPTILRELHRLVESGAVTRRKGRPMLGPGKAETAWRFYRPSLVEISGHAEHRSRMVLIRDYWNREANHRNYAGVAHDPYNDEPMPWTKVIHELTEELNVSDGEIVELILRRTGRRHGQKGTWLLVDPGQYAFVPEGNQEATRYAENTVPNL